MKPRAKYWIFLLGIAVAIFSVILGSFYASWYHLTVEEQDFVWKLADKLLAFPILGAVYLVMIIGTMVSLLFRYYIIPTLKLGEETKLISVVNPGHRIEPRGAKELVQLTNIINESADAYEKLQYKVEVQIQQAKRQLKEERNRLAALMSELPSGVLVCNGDGQVLLYNPQAQRMLQQSGRLIGLGRSLFNVLEREPVIHALDILSQAVRQGQKTPTTDFLVTTQSESCLRIHMAPLFDEQEPKCRIITGFVLAIEDMTRQIEADLQGDQLLQTLTETMNFSTLEIREAISTILSEPDLSHEELTRHRLIIDRASLAMEDQLQHARAEYARFQSARTKAENVLGTDLVELIAKHMSQRLGVQVKAHSADDLWLRLDSFTLNQGLARLGDILKQAGIDEIVIDLHQHGERESHLNVSWPGRQLDPQVLLDWQRRPLIQDAKQQPVSFIDLVAQYEGTVTVGCEEGGVCGHLHLTLPLVEPEQHWRGQPGPEHRPIYYEFDLFHQTGLGEFGRIPLNKLTYVVFDTETTGLNPSGGDEIIQIGAIRIVNGRILYDEIIDQLVDPQRPVPQESVDIHGIKPELLLGQPTIGEVLPTFHHFAEGSVLVAHNAAFDMRLLQLKEELTGLHFDHAVLDTLLLSWVVHPNQENHGLDEIARMFDIPVVGRHTALGDAIVTAEILVRLLPLLEANGIHTLEDAIKASAESPYNRLKY
jgi:DNA polymerase-3 subunit epsilon